MLEFADVKAQALDEMELRILRDFTSGYRAELLMTDGEAASASIGEPPWDDLKKATSDAQAYGRRLADWVFQGKVATGFKQSRSRASDWGRHFNISDPGSDELASGLRLRLSLQPDANDLHGLWWEAILSPEGDEPLATTTAFSRFLRVDRRGGTLVRERPLRLLLVACNPSGLGEFGHQPINVSLELDILKDATQRLSWMLDVQRLVGHVTLDQVRERILRGFHIVHLLLHAAPSQGDLGVGLLFSDPDGGAEPIAGEEVAKSLVPTERPPFLLFLATPQETSTAEADDCKTPVALAPAFVAAGVQAAVAMQSSVGVKSLQRFTQRFYAVLTRTGVVDLAMALARAEIHERGSWDWTSPVLCMRTPTAQLFQPLPERLESSVRGFSFK